MKNFNLSLRDYLNPRTEEIMSKGKSKPTRKRSKRRRDIKDEMLRDLRLAGFDQETTESLIKEIEEICAFEDSLKD
jgi:hypothetical protein